MKVLRNKLLLIIVLSMIMPVYGQDNCLVFDGTDDYVSCGNIPVGGSQSFTYSAWIYSGNPAAKHWQGIIYHGLGAASQGHLGINPTGYLSGGTGNGTNWQTHETSFFVPANTWVFVSMVVNRGGENISFYANGLLIETYGHSAIPTSTSEDLKLAIGAGGEYFTGKMDEVRIWNEVRTEAQIRQNMYQELNGSESGLMAYYKFNETSGTTADNAEGTSSYDGTLTNMTGNEWQISPAMFGPKNCLEFDGINDFVTTGSALVNFTNDMTIEAWFKTTNSSGYNSIVTMEEYNPSGNSFFQLLTNSAGKVWLWDANNSELILTTESYNDGIWHHAVFVRNSAIKTIYLYIDGDLKGSKTYTLAGVTNSNIELRFGNSGYQSGSYQMDGMLDEIRIWNDVRSITEIRENMCKSLTGNESGLVGYYTFDNSTGTTLPDLSGNGNDGTLTNMSNDDWVSSAAFNNWLNTTSTAWSTASNWSRGTIPVSTDNVGIYDWGSSDPVIPTGQTVQNLQIGSSVTTQIGAGDNLSVNGNLFAFGNFSIESTASGTGSLIVNGTSTGNITMQRYMNNADFDNWQDGWHFLSSPVAAQAISPNFVTDPITNYDFYCWHETTNEWVNFKNTSVAPTWETANTISNGLSNNAANFLVGKGYMVAYNEEGTKSFTGELNVAAVSVSGLDVSDGGTNRSWHLLGNPFSSGLTWDDSWTKTTIGGTINIWNEAGQSYTPITAAASGIIPATNGFMVQALQDGSALTIPASKRTHGGSFYKAAEFPVIKLKANNMDYPSFQESQLLFIPESTAGYEAAYDCDFLAGYAPQFYSKIDEMPMMVNSMPYLEETTVVPFTFIKNEGVNFSIEMFEVENIEMDVWLLDKKLNKEQNLTLYPTYHFTAFENDNPDRFAVYFSPVGLEDLTTGLPINIYAFNSKIEIRSNKAIDATVFVYTVAGQLLGEHQLHNQSSASISLNHFKGAVLVSVVSDKGVINKQVIVW